MTQRTNRLGITRPNGHNLTNTRSDPPVSNIEQWRDCCLYRQQDTPFPATAVRPRPGYAPLESDDRMPSRRSGPGTTDANTIDRQQSRPLAPLTLTPTIRRQIRRHGLTDPDAPELTSRRRVTGQDRRLMTRRARLCGEPGETDKGGNVNNRD